MFYWLQPDVPGFLGDRTVLDTTVRPPRVQGVLHFQIDNWFGDDLITSYPCYLVTTTMAAALERSGLGRFEIRGVDVTYGDGAHERLIRHGVGSFAEFRWLDIGGAAGHDDLGLTPRGRLVVSDAALAVFGQGVLDRCEAEEYDPGSHR
ncbi:hypothetical protein [Saccharopolyspora griseoalba]|uniref:Uncharacterized protein n=1 Tax=Saccharopolyspora griseoalba TaxID=1431848 RepID=A0ABW2LQJ6_9PSEU